MNQSQGIHSSYSPCIYPSSIYKNLPTPLQPFQSNYITHPPILLTLKYHYSLPSPPLPSPSSHHNTISHLHNGRHEANLRRAPWSVPTLKPPIHQPSLTPTDRANAPIAQLLRRFENLIALAPVRPPFPRTTSPSTNPLPHRSPPPPSPPPPSRRTRWKWRPRLWYVDPRMRHTRVGMPHGSNG